MARALPQPDAPMTADEFIRFSNARPDNERWELFHGVPVLSPSAIDHHQIIVGNLTTFLDNIADERRSDWVAMPGFGVLIQGPRGDSVPTPDVIVRPAAGSASIIAPTRSCCSRWSRRVPASATSGSSANSTSACPRSGTTW